MAAKVATKGKTKGKAKAKRVVKKVVKKPEPQKWGEEIATDFDKLKSWIDDQDYTPSKKWKEMILDYMLLAGETEVIIVLDMDDGSVYWTTYPLEPWETILFDGLHGAGYKDATSDDFEGCEYAGKVCRYCEAECDQAWLGTYDAMYPDITDEAIKSARWDCERYFDDED